MLFCIDRLQIIDNQLICFEFIDIDKQDNLKKGVNYPFLNGKIEILKKIFQNNFYLVQYSYAQNMAWVKTSCFSRKYTFEQFSDSFSIMNNLSNLNKDSSKKLGAVTESKGDPYIQSLLTSIYQETDYKNTNFIGDDNGIELVQKSLQESSTYGFDFDLFEPQNKIIIEFLKRENTRVTNKTAHPNRYTGQNYKKFLSLWKAAKLLNWDNPNLFLVNYSDDSTEEITLIRIIDFEVSKDTPEKMINSDIGYLFQNQSTFFNWLSTLSTNPTSALSQLNNLPKQIRDKNFWECKPEIFKPNIGKEYI